LPRCFTRLLYAIAEIPELGVALKSTGILSGVLWFIAAKTLSLEVIF